MIDFAKIEGFDWDDGNIGKNKKRHGVDTQECEDVFFNEPLLIGVDKKHSALENRWHTLGITGGGRKVSIAFTIRKNLIRIISARDMSRNERKIYEKN